MLRQAIVTKYLGPTNFKGSRIKASASAGSIIRGINHALRSEEAHTVVAMEFAKGKDWYGKWIAGGMPDGRGNVFVYVPGSENVKTEEFDDYSFSLPNPHAISAEELHLYAVNTSEFYSEFCDMAKRDL